MVKSVLVDRISKNIFRVGENEDGRVYVVYKGDKNKDKDWWKLIVYDCGMILKDHVVEG
jgi:hypothetical protein